MALGFCILSSGIGPITEALKAHVSVRSLHLEYCDLCESDGVDLADMLVENAGITELRLSSNKLGARGVWAVAWALANWNNTLHTLQIGDHSFGRRGLAAVVCMLKRNQSLEELGVTWERDKEMHKVVRSLLKDDRVNPSAGDNFALRWSAA